MIISMGFQKKTMMKGKKVGRLGGREIWRKDWKMHEKQIVYCVCILIGWFDSVVESNL